MSPLNCCGSRRAISPDTQPNKLVSDSQANKRFTLSSHSLTPIENVRHGSPIHSVPTSAAEQNGRNNSPANSSGHELLPLHDTEASIHRRHSSRNVHEVSSQIKKRISRDSGMFQKSSKRGLKTSMSFEDTERRAELKRALHGRVRDSLLDDSTTDDNRYDEDAVPIRTPKASLKRLEGSIHISPRNLGNVIRRTDSPSNSIQHRNDRRERSQFSTDTTALALSRMLTQRAASSGDETEHQVIDFIDETPKRSQSQNYVFDNEETPKPIPKGRSQSPLERTSTVVHASHGSSKLEPDLSNPPLLYDTRDRALSLLSSHQFKWDEPANRERLEPPSSKRDLKTLPAAVGLPQRPLAHNIISSGIYDTKIRPASEDWLRGASGLLGSPGQGSNAGEHRTGTDRDDDCRHSCHPDNEERHFGGIDGEIESPPGSIYHTARTRNHSEGNQRSWSAHIYNVHIPKRLLSRSFPPSIALPHMSEPRCQQSFASGGSAAFSVKSRRHPSISSHTDHSTSSPGFQNSLNIAASTTAPWRSSSSIYSSQPESMEPSQTSSLQRIASLHERLLNIRLYVPSEEIVSVPASRGKSIDLEKLEQRSSDISYHSSNESLLEHELAAAETRFVPLPRVNTCPKDSRFKEELDEISAKIALTNPVRRRVSNLDGSGEWNRASQAVFDRNAASIWERALRDHSHEDATLKHTRLGSEVPEGIGPKDTYTESTGARKASAQPPSERNNMYLSSGIGQETSLQDRLASYKLPRPSKSPSTVPRAKDVQRPAPVHSESSWARYPSHTRQERSSSPAGEQDHVIARDFAPILPITPPGKLQTSHGSGGSKTKEAEGLGKHVISTIKHVYRTQSRELERRLANEARGHRSSISQGGVTEYPELEMLGSMSPPLPSPDVESKQAAERVLYKISHPNPVVVVKKRKSKTSPSPTKNLVSEEDEAKQWSKMYQDCIVDPTAVAAATSNTQLLRKSASEGIGPKEKDPKSRRQSKVKDASKRGSSSDLRASTLDFKRSLEMDELGARERLVEMMGGGGIGIGVGVGV